ncbi:uncharacterized protein LOC110538018 isoform X2 [Oncorhynchus mykiss]|uniref:uncharacterized protein LOC110538018 isoform X2 n=1 Tax=Oncorhynchus mykiss TaxID=8022 RepID=UPI001877DEB9|nr:uncharacterized protein LOC110538018 isoform X2 [Oncorhynchus mykiss]
MTTPPIPPRKSFLVKSSTVTGSCDLPSLQEDSDNQEENASTNDRDNGSLWNSQTPGAAMSRSQSPFRPNFVTASDRRPQMSEPQTSSQTGSLTDYQSPRLSPRPVRRPPVPPKTHGTLLSPSPTASGDYNNVDRSKLGMTEKALDVYGKNKPSPPPLPRPVRPPRSPMMSRSSSEYERTLPEMHLLQPQDSIERKHSQSPRPARPPARPKSETQSLYGGYDVNRSQSPRPSNTDNKRSPHPSRPPPRPGGPPSHTLSRSPSGIETTTTQLQPLLQPTNGKGGSPPARPQLPPPPSFTPPPPPVNKPPLPYRPTTIFHSESVYSEVSEVQDQLSYLEVLPDENTFQFNASSSVDKTQAAPQFQPGQRCQNYQFNKEAEEFENLMRWMKTVGCWENMPPSFHGLSLEDETREFSQRCLYVKNGLCLFHCLLMKRSDTLRGHITELNDLAEKLDKVQKKTKTMSIAGGTTGVMGGVVAVVGIVLAPITMGASLIGTAVGAGMVASGTGMGIKATVDNKINSVDRKRLEEVVQKYTAEIADVELCLCFIHSGMAELRRYNFHRLQHADPEALRIARVAEAVHPGCNKSQQLGMKSKMILQGFAGDMDLYYTDKDGQRLKKGSETMFATRIRGVTQELQEELNELHQVWQTFFLAASRF